MYKSDKNSRLNNIKGAAILTLLSILLAGSAVYVEFSRIENKEPKSTEIIKFNIQTKSAISDD
jgi:hypothetical protein